MSEVVENNSIDEKPQTNQPDTVGLDIGTMNLVCARMNAEEIETSMLRNVFLDVERSSIETMNMSYVSHAELDGKTYILSEDAYNFANIFGRQVSRPMHRGIISPMEIDSVDILVIMLKELLGQGNGNSICCYSVPADSIDTNRNVIYHKRVFDRIIRQLGYKPVPLNEGVAVVYSECADNDFTGIGISFGAGLTNVAVVFKSVSVLTFSLSRGGDWIDENAAMSVGSVSNRMTSLKEKESFNLLNFNIGKKKERRIREALIYYYRSLIDYTMKHIVQELDKLEVEFPDDVPVIVSGGTSMAKGYIDTVSDILDNYDFPFDISEIKSASNPLTAVAKGCLIKSGSEQS